ncbi:MAG: dihydrolipoamide acetyltransferase family protein [Planctomycetota bacterium]|nr:dihydrolipoamide acetyltransferase family protein [Planctomycetota bacterium]
MSIEITMPRLSDTMEQGTIIKWNVAEGDVVSAGDAVADIETDKATMEMQVFDDGTIARILVGQGKIVDVGTVIAILAEEGEDREKVAATVAAQPAVRRSKHAGAQPPPAADPDKSTVTATATASSTTQAPAPPPQRETAGDGRVRLSPVARRLAQEHAVDVNTLQGSGPGGRIVKRDVLRAVEAGQETAAAIPPSAKAVVPATPVPIDTTIVQATGVLEEATVALSNMRQTIARRLVEAKATIPHYQVTVTFNMDPLLELRRTLNDQLDEQGVRLSINDFLVRGCALAMHQHPQFNASWRGDHIKIHGIVNIGLAIALPAERGGGLVVATIRNADQKTLRAISLESKHLAGKARTRGLTLEEMADATFTLSNLGMFGVEHFTAIINPPNCAILAVGAALQKPVVRHGEMTVGHEMSATLSLDHRVIDGAMAAQYLATLKQLIENPATLLV